MMHPLQPMWKIPRIITRPRRAAIVLAACIIPAIASLCAGCAGAQSRTVSFVREALRRRPASELQDLYKLHYQGCFGVGHMISSRDNARSYLLEELRTVGTGGDEPLVEPCDPSNRLLRVNLGPFQRRAMDPERLLDAMMETAADHVPDTAMFLAAWSEVGAMIRAGELPFALQDYDRFTADLRQRGWPAVHHSAAYNTAYHPAYRVVLRSVFTRLFPASEER
jgi:hypothetical protein